MRQSNELLALYSCADISLSQSTVHLIPFTHTIWRPIPFAGLHGIELGTQMIREVGRKIRADFPNISKYSSLSPIPGFRDYLLSEIRSVIKRDATCVRNFLTEHELLKLTNYLHEKSRSASRSPTADVWPFLYEALRSNQWLQDATLESLMCAPLMRKCAHYLHEEKRRGYALNTVGEFELRNELCVCVRALRARS